MTTIDTICAKLAIEADRFDPDPTYDARIEAIDLIRQQAAEIARLRDEFAEVITFAETRRQDGIEMGAAVWRIALEDIVKDARAALERPKL